MPRSARIYWWERLHYLVFRCYPRSVAHRRIEEMNRLEAQYADDPRGYVAAMRDQIKQAKK